MVLAATRSIWQRCPLPSANRKYITTTSLPIITMPQGSNIYAFGAPSRSSTPLISNLDWTVRDGEAWAVISGTGGGGKGVIFKTLLGHARLAPPTPQIQGQWAAAGGLYPFLSLASAPYTTPVDPYTRVAHVSFRQRTGGASGAFFDYTARYGAMREAEDRITLRDTLIMGGLSLQNELFDRLTEQMGLTRLLDLPMITLSNGQTRRARVVKAILDRPELLLLDEPLTGLDPPSRKALDATLRQLHFAKSPRMILGLRRGEQLPPWITDVLEIEDGVASTRKLASKTLASDPLFRAASAPTTTPSISPTTLASTTTSKRALNAGLLVDMKNVNVAYGDRKILTNINWQIRQGERWHLQGANGSGKTTLLALLTGDHPQSYTQAHLYLPAFASPSLSSDIDITPSQGLLQHGLQQRKRTATAHLRTLIGVVSPELADAFPRRHPGMSVWEAVTTGFDGGFVPRTRHAPRVEIPGKGHVNGNGHGGVGWVDVADAELGLGLEADSEQREKRTAELRQWRVRRCCAVLQALGPAAWVPTPSPSADQRQIASQTRDFAARRFTSLSPGEQRLVLLMRALVGRPPLVLLDEVWSGMDGAMINAARRYLRGEAVDGDVGVDATQAVVVVTHWMDEVPWTGDEVKILKL